MRKDVITQLISLDGYGNIFIMNIILSLIFIFSSVMNYDDIGMVEPLLYLSLIEIATIVNRNHSLSCFEDKIRVII